MSLRSFWARTTPVLNGSWNGGGQNRRLIPLLSYSILCFSNKNDRNTQSLVLIRITNQDIRFSRWQVQPGVFFYS